jgi:tRNA-2-methylthio-N6-dimethylallyladenosine synthase
LNRDYNSECGKVTVTGGDFIEDAAVSHQMDIASVTAAAIREKYGSPKYFIQTFGCQQNEADSQRMAGICRMMGYEETDDPSEAKLILVNTCAIREHAEKRALSIIGQYKHVKEADPDVVIGVGGCMVTQKHRADRLKMSYPYVDFVFDTTSLHLLPELVSGALNNSPRRFELSGDCRIAEGLPSYRSVKHKAWLSVMYGCNNFCSYCIVPYVRGRERSRTKEAIIAEARRLVESGAKDITLLGQNVNSYGKDLGGDYDIASLMRDICRIDGDFRLRFMTSHPKDASDRLIEVMATEDKVVNHFHLPVQSGSNDVLRRMNRRYTAEDYLKTIEKLKSSVPDVSITSDIIVGFPGETEEDFLSTLELIKTVEYDMIFSFIYSPRDGTPAAKMPNQIPSDVSSDRYKRLCDVANAISLNRNSRFIGRKLRILADEVSRTDKTMLTGRAASPRPIHFAAPESVIGSFVDAEIISADTFSLIAKLI